MTRPLRDGLQTGLLASAKSPVIFVEAEFASGTIRLWSGLREVTWNGAPWTPVGGLLTVSPIEETTELRSTGVTVSLSGITQANLSLALGEARPGKPVTLWLGLLSPEGEVIADPCIAYRGRMDVPEIEEGADTATVSVAVAHRMVDLERPRERRYTPEDQAIDYPDDRGFDYVASLQELVLTRKG